MRCVLRGDEEALFIAAKEDLIYLFLAEAATHNLDQLFALKVEDFDPPPVDGAHSHEQAIRGHR